MTPPDRPATDGLAERLRSRMLTHTEECVRDQLWFTPACECRKIIGGDVCERLAAEARRYFEERLGREALTRLIVDMLFGESNKFEPNESEYRLADAIRALLEPK